MKIFILCGPAAAGKSSYANTKRRPGVAWISRDNIRFNILKDGEDYFSHETEVFSTFVNLINGSIRDPKVKEVYIDATHLNKAYRKKILRQLRPQVNDELNAVYFSTPLEVCLERNSKRSGRALVPEETIRDMFAAFVPPTKEEGFEHIYCVDENGKEVEV